MKGDDSSNHSSTTFALLKNSTLLPDPLMEKSQTTTYDNQFIELDSVDSTNNYAMGLIHEGLAKDGIVCLAHHQWAGKGQRGKSWHSEAGQNLMMSLITAPAPLRVSRQFLFSAAVANGILNCLQLYEKQNWRIKWPNDIYWNDRKAAGILIESVIRGKNWLYAVTGVGMNLNQESFPLDVPNAISLKQITGKKYDALSIAREMVPCIQKCISALHQDPELTLKNFNQSLYKLNHPVSLKKGDDLILTRIKGVDLLGLLHTEHGAFRVGEVELITDLTIG
jgi:BirA family biotin operon repressor/biotin-[acetyl-CoA-carboxylase] ligase